MTTSTFDEVAAPAWSIRPEQPLDLDQIHDLHRAAFGRPDEAELVDAIRSGPDFIPELSLVAAAADGSVLGHVLVSRIGFEEEAFAARGDVLALAPLAVLPPHGGRASRPRSPPRRWPRRTSATSRSCSCSGRRASTLASASSRRRTSTSRARTPMRGARSRSARGRTDRRRCRGPCSTRGCSSSSGRASRRSRSRRHRDRCCRSPRLRPGRCYPTPTAPASRPHPRRRSASERLSAEGSVRRSATAMAWARARCHGRSRADRR